ncbi:hypothetical protein ACHAWF_013878 [Thalassiosira exigua]
MSLRLAIKRSLEQSESALDRSPSGVDGVHPPPSARPAPARRRRPRPDPADDADAEERPVAAAAVELPPIAKRVRNADPHRINEFGFCEVSRAISWDLAVRILDEATDKVARLEGGRGTGGGGTTPSPSSTTTTAGGGGGGGGGSRSSHPHNASAGLATGRRFVPGGPGGGGVWVDPEVEEISNALQTDVSDGLLEEVRKAVDECDAASEAMRAVFGQRGPSGTTTNYDGFVLETPKVLVAKPGMGPQLPHADDHCTSCLACIVHLRDDQRPTVHAPYRGATKDYPTGITVTCDDCGRESQLPDRDYRRGVHLTDEGWTCGCCRAAATASTSPPKHVAYDFEGGVATAFAELLDERAPVMCDAYAGKRRGKRGNGILCLPTLIHRGPGCPASSVEPRCMLFFTLRPTYRNLRREGDVVRDHHRYNADLQIHASCVLYNRFKKVQYTYAKAGCGIEGYFGAIVGAEASALSRDNSRLREENRKLREKITKAANREDEAKDRLEEENRRLREAIAKLTGGGT